MHNVNVHVCEGEREKFKKNFTPPVVLDFSCSISTRSELE